MPASRQLYDYHYRVFVTGFLLLLTAVLSLPARADSKNGFELSNAAIPVDEILSGGPPRDGIPAIDDPIFLSATQVDFLTPEQRVLGVVRNGIAKAYPISILNWHEIVNDQFGEEGIVVTFCPLCGTGMAFLADIKGQRRSFGVSGLLYNSDVLLYDRTTESLWSQLMMRAVSGPLSGTALTLIPTTHTTWADWRERYPATRVLSTETGYARDYQRNPYTGYEQSDFTFFPVPKASKRFHPKEIVLGVALDGTVKAYPFSELARAPSPVQDRIGTQPVSIEFDAEHRTGRILNAAGEEIPSVMAYWFAWSAFHPETAIFTTPR
ncbi:MAG: DUF3179 domain-containing protein [Gammaproteobacteria bacterium]